MINLLSSLMLLPLVAMDLVSPISLPGQCVISEAVSHLIASLSLLSTLIIAMDQYLAIIHALRYHHHVTRLRSSLTLGIVWVLSSIFSIITVFFKENDTHICSSCHREDAYKHNCQASGLNVLLIFAITSATFVAPLLLVSII